MHVARLDVTQCYIATQAFALVEQALGGIDLLVNNAEYGLMVAVEDEVASAYRQLFETNVFGLIEVTQAAPPTSCRKGGRIVSFFWGIGPDDALGHMSHACEAKLQDAHQPWANPEKPKQKLIKGKWPNPPVL